MTVSLCRPKWIDELAYEVQQAGEGVLSSGCSYHNWDCCGPRGCDTKRIYDCDAYDMLDRVRAKWPQLADMTIEEYAIARALRSEVGQGNLFERVAIAEASINEASKHGGILNTSTKDIAGRPYFSGQCGNNPSFATREDPTLADIVIARWALDGKTDDFARGADIYFAPGHYNYAGALDIYNSWSGDHHWVGRIPGVSSYDQFFMKSGGADPTEYFEGLGELGVVFSPESTKVDPDSLEPCGLLQSSNFKRSLTWVGVSLAGVAAAVGGAWWWRTKR